MAAMAHKKESQVDLNYAAFVEQLPKLLETHAGKFAVMNDGKIIEYFDSLTDAVKFGAVKFGDSNFSVQEVVSQNVNLGFHSYAVHHLPV